MLTDGLSMMDGSEAKRVLTDATKRGSSFPQSPSDGAVFELVVESGGNSPGIYFYSAVDAVWVIKYPNSDLMPYDVGGSVHGTMQNGAVLMNFVAVRSFRLREGFNGCLAFAKTAASADTTLNVIRISRTNQPTVIGSIFFGIAETVGIFTQNGSGDMSVSAGEFLTVQAPLAADSTLADVAFTFAGSLL